MKDYVKGHANDYVKDHVTDYVKDSMKDYDELQSEYDVLIYDTNFMFTKHVQHSNNVENTYLSPEKVDQDLNFHHINKTSAFLYSLATVLYLLTKNYFCQYEILAALETV